MRLAHANLSRSDAGVKTSKSVDLNCKSSFWPFSPAKPRGSHRLLRFFTTERPFYLALPNRLCQQRALSSDSDNTEKAFANHSEGKSSRPRPVNRLQATCQPRRVMRGGSKLMLGSGQTKDRPVQGKLSLSPVKQTL